MCRPFWAEVRSKYFSTGVNRTYMEAIEKAAFFLNLDPQDAGVSLVSNIHVHSDYNYNVIVWRK